MSTTISSMLKKKIELGMSYPEYLEIGEQLLAQGKTSGTDHSETMLHYSKLNMHRMHRLNKTFKVIPELQEAVAKISKPLHFLIISEIWCGDAAQNIPIIAKLAELNEHIQISIVWRDENLELMDMYLTNGGRSIPKLIIVDGDTHEELTTWGPRPATVQQMVMDRKKQENPEPYSEFVKKAQLWYAKNKTQDTQLELLEVFRALDI